MSECCAPGPRESDESTRPGTTMPTYAVRRGVAFPDWSVVTSPLVKEALLTMVGSDHLLKRWGGYSLTEDRVRTTLLQLYAEQGLAPTVETIKERAGLPEQTVRPALEGLWRRDFIVLDAAGERILGAYPFTDRDTGHRVDLGGRVVNAMCAVDALGIGAMLDRDITIDARCRECGAPIQIMTRDGGRTVAGAEPSESVVWLGVHYAGACAANSLCAATVFFCSDAHLASWRRRRASDEPGVRLSIEEAHEAGHAIFGPSLAGVGTPNHRGDEAAAARGGSAPRSGSPSSGVLPASRHTGASRRAGGSTDLVVIGAGSAGFSAAITAAELGAEVALIGHGTIGGTCTNVGCIPSKTLIRAAETLHNARVAARFAGISARADLNDWRATVRQKDALVAELRQAKYLDVLPAYDGISYRKGAARLARGGVEVEGTLVPAGKIVITTGARPAIPAIPGIDAVPYLTSTTALELEELPRSLLVIGGGYIGAELAQLFARAGVAVTLVCRSQLLPKAEPEIGAALTRYFADEGIKVIGGVIYRTIRKTDNGVALAITRNDEEMRIDAEAVLVATGRAPNIEGLELAEHGIVVTAKGEIVLDDYMRTTVSGIYAAGDVTGRDQFVYMAAYGAKLAALNALNGDIHRYENRVVPAVVFTDPQVASVGLTEAAARAAGLRVRASVIGLDQVPRALVARDTRGLIKLVAEADSGKLLGAHILAPEGADSIQTATLAIACGLTVQQVAGTIFPYLTTVEGLKLATLAFDKDVAKLSCCAG